MNHLLAYALLRIYRTLVEVKNMHSTSIHGSIRYIAQYIMVTFT